MKQFSVEPDGIMEEYLRLRELREAGRRAQSLRLRVSRCCLQPVEDLRGWEICVLCRRQAEVVELESIYKVPGRWDRWKRMRVRSGAVRGSEAQERWTLHFLDRWLRIRALVEGRPRGVTAREWRLMLTCWAALLTTTLGRDAVAAQLGMTPGQVRYRVERARDVIRERALRSGPRLATHR